MGTLISSYQDFLLKTFLCYVKKDTTSDSLSESMPSTGSQLIFLSELKNEIDSFNFGKTHFYDNGFLMVEVDANVPGKDCIGFVSHVDTSPDYSGSNIKPIITKDFDGSDLIYKNGDVLSAAMFPELLSCVGDTIISSDGSTLLGADDKAGVSEMVTLLKILSEHPEIEHGRLLFLFTSDEEIGKGIDGYPANDFKPDYAFTMDGGQLGEIEYECFNAISVMLKIKGSVIHLGKAKNKLINAVDVASTFISMLPKAEKPETTENREGYFCPVGISGGLEESVVSVIIRDFDMTEAKNRLVRLNDICSELIEIYPGAIIELNSDIQYTNMLENIPQNVIDRLNNAMKKSEIKPIISPIRGGTDGSRLSELGIPCPNIFAGGVNFHSKYEWVSLQTMLQSVNVMLNIL